MRFRPKVGSFISVGRGRQDGSDPPSSSDPRTMFPVRWVRPKLGSVGRGRQDERAGAGAGAGGGKCARSCSWVSSFESFETAEGMSENRMSYEEEDTCKSVEPPETGACWSSPPTPPPPRNQESVHGGATWGTDLSPHLPPSSPPPSRTLPPPPSPECPV